MPLFMKSEGLQTCWIPYLVVAGVAHLGSCPTDGHYRAALFHSGEMLLADDFQLPARMIRTPEFQQNVYMLWIMPQADRNNQIWSRPMPMVTPDPLVYIAGQLAS